MHVLALASADFHSNQNGLNHPKGSKSIICTVVKLDFLWEKKNHLSSVHFFFLKLNIRRCSCFLHFRARVLGIALQSPLHSTNRKRLKTSPGT